MNRTLEEALRHYVLTCPTSLPQPLSCVEFAINNSKQASTQHSPFYLNYGFHPQSPTTASLSSVLPSVLVWSKSMQDALQRAKQSLQRAQDRQKTLADQSRRDISYAPGQMVLLSTKNLSVKVGNCRKLLPKWVGPFAVEKMIGPAAVKLTLPEDWKIHPVFHVSLLKPYRSDGSVQPVIPSGFELLQTDALTVERILDHRIKSVPKHAPITEYLCKWHGRDVLQATWEPVRNLGSQAGALITAYENSLAAVADPMQTDPAEVPTPILAEPVPGVAIEGLDLFDD